MQQSVSREPKTRKAAAKVATAKKNGDHLSLVETVKPKTEGQRQMMFAFDEGMNVVAHGSAGTGKSYVACYLALKRLFAREINKIVIVRSAVATRDMGFLPGSLEEKSDPYKIPYKQIINHLCGNGTAWDILVKKNMIEFITSSYVRGITIEDCTIIVDEFANMNWHEVNSIITRLGENTQLVVLGDTKQCDLNKTKEKSCFDQLVQVCERMPKWFDVIEFRPQDIVRSEFVKEWIINSEMLMN